MQLSVFSSLTSLFPLGSWARSSHSQGANDFVARSAIVVLVPTAAPAPGLATALRSAGCRLQGAQSIAGGVAMLLICPPAVAAELLTLPRPVSRGSRTAGNLLPW
jgi:hypothetical protein